MMYTDIYYENRLAFLKERFERACNLMWNLHSNEHIDDYAAQELLKLLNLKGEM
jgi:hypothetical protein